MGRSRTVTGTLIVAAILAACSEAKSSDPFAERNGETEARADIARGAPLKLYFHQHNGVVPQWVTAGIQSCKPDGSRVFQSLDEADWQEGKEYTTEESRRQE